MQNDHILSADVLASLATPAPVTGDVSSIAIATSADDTTKLASAVAKPSSAKLAKQASAKLAPAKPASKPAKAKLRTIGQSDEHTEAQRDVYVTSSVQASEANARGGKAKPVNAKPAKPAVDADKPSTPRGIERTAATVVRNATNYEAPTDRDSAYLIFFASFCAASKAYAVTLADIAKSGRKPAYNGSAKPTDAGVINRLRKAGRLAVSADGHTLSFSADMRKRDSKLHALASAKAKPATVA